MTAPPVRTPALPGQGDTHSTTKLPLQPAASRLRSHADTPAERRVLDLLNSLVELRELRRARRARS
jgi:hypothetical protein